MYKESFKKFYWAFILIIIDFRLQGFDILPDFLGYLFIIQGLSSLAEVNGFFQRAKKLALPMLLLSILSFYEAPGSNLVFGLATVVFVAIGIIDLLLVYSLFMGIRQLAEERRLDMLALEAESSWRYYLFISLAGIMAIGLLFVPVLLVMYILIVFFFNIYVLMKILKFMNLAREEL